MVVVTIKKHGETDYRFFDRMQHFHLCFPLSLVYGAFKVKYYSRVTFIPKKATRGRNTSIWAHMSRANTSIGHWSCEVFFFGDRCVTTNLPKMKQTLSAFFHIPYHLILVIELFPVLLISSLPHTFCLGVFLLSGKRLLCSFEELMFSSPSVTPAPGSCRGRRWFGSKWKARADGPGFCF